MKQFCVNVLAVIVAFILITLGVGAYDETKKKVKKRKAMKKAHKTIMNDLENLAKK